MKRALPLILAVAAACATPAPRLKAPGPAAGITADRLLPIIRELASDEHEGRAPGTPGEERTVAFLGARLKALGLEPGNPDGTYFQALPLVGFKSSPSAAFRAGDKTVTPEHLAEYVASSRHAAAETKVEGSELVFVGYGVKAPEYDWDDYKGTDVRGKTLVMLINDPAVPDPKDPKRLDEKAFKGRAMTYYGRWTYKFEIASELGASAALIIHETEPAGYPWEVVSGSFGKEQFDVRGLPKPFERVSVEGWISSATARRVLSLSGHDYDRLKAAALRRDFKPVPLGTTFDATVRNAVREVDSKNMIARITGSEPERRDQYVVHSAHWDHLGTDPKLPGDKVFNGAVDNATGVAALLEIAAAYKRLPQPPQRSVLFLFTGAEEKGLLGAKYYAERPLYPLAKTVAVLNMDAMNPWGATSDIAFLGLEHSDLDRYAAMAAKGQGRELSGDPSPEKGLFFRSDHFPFAKAGVPALDIQAGMQVVGETPGWGRRKREEYTANDYHKPSDEVKPGWKLDGMALDTRAMFHIGLALASETGWPEWKRGSEFKAVRDESRAERR